jgi:hypothetical protein
MRGGRAGYRKFIQEGVKEGHRQEYYEEHETPKPKAPIIAAVRGAARALEVEPAVLSGADRSWQMSRCRALVAYVLVRRFGYKLKDGAKCLGRDLATVSSLVSRYSDRMGKDEGLKKQAAQVARHCLQ